MRGMLSRWRLLVVVVIWLSGRSFRLGAKHGRYGHAAAGTLLRLRRGARVYTIVEKIGDGWWRWLGL